MISTHEKAEIASGLFIEVNWNKKVTPCKKMRVTDINTSAVYDVERDDFFGMMFMFADEDQQLDMIPAKSTEVRMEKRMLKIRTLKDMKKGELMDVPYEYPVPLRKGEMVDKEIK